MPRTPSELLARMRSVHSASPRLVWHGADGRIELSGRVFDNWVAKTSNLLVDELDAVPGTAVDLDLPPHWKSLALAFACWQVGCTVVLPGAEDGTTAEPDLTDLSDILVTAREVPPVDPPRLLVCVALGSLAFRWDGTLPRGAVDYAAEVRAQGDVFLGDGDLGPDSGTGPDIRIRASASGGTEQLTAGALVALLTPPSPLGAPATTPNAPTTLLAEPGTSLLYALAAAVATWEQDGTLVLIDEGVEVSDSMLRGERITGRLTPA